MNLQIDGTIEVIYPVEDRRGFRSCNIVINVPHMSNATQYVTVQFVSSSIKELDEFSPGDRVSVYAKIKGRRWTPPDSDEVKYFNSIQALSIEFTN